MSDSPVLTKGHGDLGIARRQTMSVAANPVPAQLNAFVELNGTKKLDELNSLNIREAYSWDRDQVSPAGRWQNLAIHANTRLSA